MATGRVKDNNAGRLKLANATPFTWKRCRHGSKGTSCWSFPGTVQPGQTVEVTIAFSGGGESAHGQVGYQMEIEEGDKDSQNPTFTITANSDGLVAQLPEEMQNAGWFAVPPAPHKIAGKGWQKGSTVSFTIGALGGDSPNVRGGHTTHGFQGVHLASHNGPPDVCKELNCHGEVLPQKGDTHDNEQRGLGGFFKSVGRQLQVITNDACGTLSDIGAPNRPAGGRGEGNWTQQWMKAYAPAIANLKLDDMSIPGTHDSGTAKMSNPIVGPWASTQRLSIPAQLKAGVRALDIRVGYVGPEAQKNDKVHDGIAVVHDKHTTSLSLRNALVAVKQFVQQNPSEIIFLDFHRFPGLGHGPPHEKAAKVVMDVLNDIMIYPKFRHQAFGKLQNQKGRVVVLWNAQEARDPHFWPGVKQAWNGADNIRDLHALASTELTAKKGRLWSMPLVLPAGVPRPVPHIPEQLDEWVAVGGLWQSNASIVTVDFIEETQLVRNCIGGCLIKAAHAHASETVATSQGGGGHGGGRRKGGGAHKKQNARK